MVPSYLRSTYRLCQQHQSILYVIIFFDEKILQKFTELPDVPPEYFQGHQGVNALSTQELPSYTLYPLLNYSVVGGKVCNPELYLGEQYTL